MRPKFIAEVSSNHHKDLSRCLEFVDVAHAIGCDAVKFQLFKIDQLFAPEVLLKSKAHRDRREWELPVSFIAPIHQHCKEKGIEFSCTPFYLAAVDELSSTVDFFKIASYELLWDDLLSACAQSQKPVVLSVGMATEPEIDHAVDVLRRADVVDLTLLHCISAYPTPVEQCNLSIIEQLRNRYQCKVGWSDHSTQPSVVHRAVHHWRAECIEFHLDLDGAGEEYEAGHCWLPADISSVIDVYSRQHVMDGDGYKVAMPAEAADRNWRADPEDGLRPLKIERKNW